MAGIGEISGIRHRRCRAPQRATFTGRSAVTDQHPVTVPGEQGHAAPADGYILAGVWYFASRAGM
jgi:hypothetical protein